MAKNKRRADGRYAVQVYLGKGEDGKRKYKTVYGKTQKEANQKALEVKLKLSKGINVLNEKTPFQTFRELWLAGKKQTVSPTTYISYEGLARHTEQFDLVPIKDITEYSIQTMIDELAAHNPKTQKPTSHKTLLNIKTTIQDILSIAVKQGILLRNPADGVTIPRQAPTHHREALTEEQIKMIEETPHRAQTAAMIMLYAGLRRGELLALTWDDIDLKEKCIRVNKSTELIKNTASVKNRTKTKAGMRTVYIPDKLVTYLKTVPHTSEYVVPTAAGKLMNDKAWQRLWESYMTDLNFKYAAHGMKNKFQNVPMLIDTFTAHQLRHTFATMLYKSGVDVLTAKEQLGHEDIATTLGIYTHLDSTFKKREINKLNEYLG